MIQFTPVNVHKTRLEGDEEFPGNYDSVQDHGEGVEGSEIVPGKELP